MVPWVLFLFVWLGIRLARLVSSPRQVEAMVPTCALPLNRATVAMRDWTWLVTDWNKSRRSILVLPMPIFMFWLPSSPLRLWVDLKSSLLLVVLTLLTTNSAHLMADCLMLPRAVITFVPSSIAWDSRMRKLWHSLVEVMP